MLKKRVASAMAVIMLMLSVLGAGGILYTAAEDEAAEPVNAALHKLAQATSAYQLTPAGWSPEGLTDGTTAAGWHDALNHTITADAPVDLTVDLQGKYSLTRMVISNSDPYKGWSGIPRGFELQVSLDGKAWTTVVTETNAKCTVGSLTYEFDAAEACYVRVHIVKDSGQHGPLTAIGEFEAWGVLLEDPNTDPLYNWPDPTPAAMETVAEDTYAGSLTFTTSADGATVTVSYTVDGETKSYTVPNNPEYLFGGYAGVDDLGRVLSDANSEDVGVIKTEQERYVGIFYFLWHGAHDQAGTIGIARNLQALLDGTSSVGYGINNEVHWFSEPLYGYYFGNDAWVQRKHVELLTNAGVDFLYFDVTNAFTYSQTAIQLMGILHEFNEKGYDAPQVVFYTNGSSEVRIGELYTDIYGKELYPDTWFRIGGKPVVIGANIHDQTLPDGQKITDFYTVKSGNWPIQLPGSEIENNFEPNNNCWPWMDFHWPQRIYTDANGGEAAINVSVSQHSGNAVFSTSTLEGYQYNRGRSFVANGQTVDHVLYSQSTADREYNRELRDSYKRAKEDPTLSYQGLNFQAQFDYAIESSAKYILVTGWNEWIAGNTRTAEDPAFVDTASIEYSRDTEMMRGGYFDNYYMQLVQNIRRVKGTAPVLVQDARKPINVTGNFDQWADVAVTYADPSGDTKVRNNRGYGAEGYTVYTNKTGRNDIVASKVVSDTKNLYFYIETAAPITQYNTESSWMQIYLDTDRDASTGWYGYDYIVNYKAKGDFETTVAKYTGENGAYGFTAEAGTVAYRAKGNQMMISVPQELLGIKNYQNIQMEFKVADSRTVYDEMEDFYCDGDSAPLGRLNYVYRNCLADATVEPGTETDTEPNTTPATEPMTEVPTDPATADSDEQTTPAERQGCRSSVSVGLVGLMALPAAAVMTVRKKKRNGAA